MQQFHLIKTVLLPTWMSLVYLYAIPPAEGVHPGFQRRQRSLNTIEIPTIRFWLRWTMLMMTRGVVIDTVRVLVFSFPATAGVQTVEFPYAPLCFTFSCSEESGPVMEKFNLYCKLSYCSRRGLWPIKDITETHIFHLTPGPFVDGRMVEECGYENPKSIGAVWQVLAELEFTVQLI